MRRVAAIALLLVALTPLYGAQAEGLNAGFVQGLWYSEDDIFAGEPVRIYAALRNNSEHDLTATVQFTVNEKRIATKAISALPGRLVETWADWTATYGEHTITATLADIKVHKIGEPVEAADVKSQLAEELIFVDYDTDGDGIGNKVDTDDDNDEIDDDEEVRNGTDPLVFNEPEPELDETADDDSGEQKDPAVSSTVEAAADATGEGLERFTENSAIDTVLTGITNTVERARTSLDNYRAERVAKRETSTTQDETLEGSAQTGTTTSTDTATITRHQIEKEQVGVFTFLVQKFGGLLSGVYTLALFLLSKLLSHPELIQLLLLFGILYGIYKLARRIGRRPIDT